MNGVAQVICASAFRSTLLTNQTSVPTPLLPRWLKHIPETSDTLRYRNRGGAPLLPTDAPIDEHAHAGGHGVQSKDSFESVGSSAGTPDADVMHHSDLANIKLKTEASEHKRQHRKGSSASGASPAGRHHSSDRHHYQNAEQRQQQQHRHQSEPKASPASQAHKRKGAPHALPPDDIMGPEHEYEDIPGQSDDEDDEENDTKEDRWNDTGDEESSSRQDKDELDVEDTRRRRHADEGEDEEGSFVTGATNNSNDTRTLTQQCSLVAPNEVQVTESPSLIAEPVLSQSGGYKECGWLRLTNCD